MKKKFNIKAKIWLYPGDTPWHFVSIDKKLTKEIKQNFGAQKRGFGSLPVEVTLGKTKWRTSIFPENRSDTYLLPLKAEVRKKEDVFDGDTISFSIEIKI